MVEAMYERSPHYFKQFQKQFKFQIVEEKPTLSNTNVYAVCAHFDSEFCGLVTNHYHVLLDTTTFEKETLKRNQNFPVPCIFTTFKFLFSTATTLETNGDVFTKLKLAVEFNSSADKVDSQTVRKQLPAFACHNNTKISNAKQVNINQKPCAKMPVVLKRRSTTPVLYRNKFKLILLIVKLSEELKTFCLVLILVLFVKLWIFLLVDMEN